MTTFVFWLKVYWTLFLRVQFIVLPPMSRRYWSITIGASFGIVLSPIRRSYRSTTIKMLWIFCLVHRQKAYFNLYTTRYQDVAVCLTVLIPLRQFQVPLWRHETVICGAKWNMPPIKTPSSPVNININRTELYRWLSTIPCCHEFFIICISILINLD